jgi:hypothetical protein
MRYPEINWQAPLTPAKEFYERCDAIMAEAAKWGECERCNGMYLKSELSFYWDHNGPWGMCCGECISTAEIEQ